MENRNRSNKRRPTHGAECDCRRCTQSWVQVKVAIVRSPEPVQLDELLELEVAS